ncbi:HugZ family protein [Leadbetterella sp. DM7]|uniref:HugZ family pyridoxamine 5'-phosphate oxidase n=1 Tax=Leadbetterella sp. DM7 TaxID=3235085 RepID=UPI00349E74B4
MENTQSEVQKSTRQTKPVTPRVNELISSCKSVILATVNEEGAPNASYAPFARIENRFYILVSFMSRHTRNLRDVGKVSAMFIEDEANTRQIYARDRLTLDVQTREIKRGTPEWEQGIEKLKENHGKVLDILVTLEDFIMIELTPVTGSYVNGFGSAYYVNGQLEIMEHRNDVAHQTAEAAN